MTYTVEYNCLAFDPKTLGEKVVRNRYGEFATSNDALRYILQVWPEWAKAGRPRGLDPQVVMTSVKREN